MRARSSDKARSIAWFKRAIAAAQRNDDMPPRMPRLAIEVSNETARKMNITVPLLVFNTRWLGPVMKASLRDIRKR